MQITNALELVIKAKTETESSAFLTPWGIRECKMKALLKIAACLAVVSIALFGFGCKRVPATVVYYDGIRTTIERNDTKERVIWWGCYGNTGDVMAVKVDWFNDTMPY